MVLQVNHFLFPPEGATVTVKLAGVNHFYFIGLDCFIGRSLSEVSDTARFSFPVAVSPSPTPFCVHPFKSFRLCNT